MDAIAAPLYVKTFTQDHHTVIAPRQGLYEITDDIKAWTTAFMTGGQTPFPIILIRSRRVPCSMA